MKPILLDLVVASGLAEGSTLRDCRRVSHTALSAAFHESMTREQYREYGQALHLMHAALPYYRADWLAFGQRRFGGAFVEETVQQLQMPLEAVEESTALALIDRQHRTVRLTAAHHTAIGFCVAEQLIPAADVPKWITLAAEEELSVGDLTRSIREGRVVKSSASGAGHKNSDGFLTIQGIGTTFARWLKNVTERGAPIEKMPLEAKREIMTEIEPIALLYAQLKAEVQA